MAGHGHRNMYYLTGMPGWMRFGFSPGWIDRSPSGLPPGAQYLMQSGQMPQFLTYLQQQVPMAAPVAPQMPGMQMTKEQEMGMLESQAKMLEQQLDQIKKRLEELEK